MVMNIGEKPVIIGKYAPDNNRMETGDSIQYALEGSIFMRCRRSVAAG
jgi:glycerol kinase